MYLDPAAGSLILQALAAGIVGVLATMQRVRTAIGGFLNSLVPRRSLIPRRSSGAANPRLQRSPTRESLSTPRDGSFPVWLRGLSARSEVGPPPASSEVLQPTGPAHCRRWPAIPPNSARDSNSEALADTLPQSQKYK